MLEEKNYEIYEGDWKNGKFFGKAKYKFDTGDIYEG